MCSPIIIGTYSIHTHLAVHIGFSSLFQLCVFSTVWHEDNTRALILSYKAGSVQYIPSFFVFVFVLFKSTRCENWKAFFVLACFSE